MQIILIEDDEKLAQLFSLNISRELGHEVVIRQNAADAIGFLRILPDIRTIITKDIIDEENTGDDILDFIHASGKSAQVYVIGSQITKDYNFCNILDENTDATQLINSLINVQKIKGKGVTIEGHIPIPITSLKYIRTSPCDVYINLKQDCNDFKLVKRFSANDNVVYNDVFAYIQKGIEKFYVKEEDFPSFVDTANDIFRLDLIGNALNNESKEEIRNIVLRQIKSIGINEQSLKLAQTFLSDVDQKLSSNKNLSQISEIYESSIGYPFQRSYMCSLFCKIIGERFDWLDSQTAMSMAIASVFNDTSLASITEFNVTSEEELSNVKLSADRKKIIKNHAKIAADTLAKMNNLSPLIEQIVRHHHGNATGEGLNFNIGQKMTPVIAVFIVADNFSRLILSSVRKKINTQAYINAIHQKYPDKHIDKALESLISGLKDSK